MVIVLLSTCCITLVLVTFSLWKKARQYEAERDALQLQYDKLDKQLQKLNGTETDTKRFAKLT
jgi:cell division protein FtsL